ncbi:MetQ/NlpA family ABC transporter substrate-binding protein [Geosporobacter ferrireducens]|uniref:Lipoprotein n=1 Tax=Geosporobacter ferrireducens TaxID=1424294 RepID=A0A1D8GG24_9FIRM|nr:MetQ/NlpA family ABC transporter substrate-binding protein [Geosporobacter ferrireducens]AOT69866.1 methionine ABC transporter substrate-binding protein [Geosporobacter ferrireducens]MTI54438.1 ABC transporter substrate-binding protein [Geosporobacter ferrireducens]
MKKILSTVLLLTLTAALLFTGCAKAPAPAPVAADADDTLILKIGATPVPHAEILNFIKPQLEAQGIELEIVEFTDYVNPNLALNSKDLDANFFQHVPYMEAFSREQKMEFVSAGKVHVEPLGLYSKKISTLEDLREGSLIAIPNDPTNGGRALILLDTEGLIKLKPDAGLEATERDIVENPRNLKFKAIDAAQLPRTLEDVDAAVINTNYALEAKLNPSADALIIEGSESPYANIVTVRPDNKDSEAILKLIEVLQSEEVKQFILDKYEGAVVSAF